MRAPPERIASGRGGTRHPTSGQPHVCIEHPRTFLPPILAGVRYGVRSGYGVLEVATMAGGG